MNRTQLASAGLRDGHGGVIEIRAASGADCDAIKSFLMGLSLRARFLRFFSPVAQPSSAVLRRMCGAGPETDVLVATESGAVVGHAMAVDATEPDGRRVADIGLVVTDRWQNHGIGSELFGQMIARAAGRGVSGLVMEVLPENRRMLEMITSRWADAGYEFGAGSVTVRVRLPDTGGDDHRDSASVFVEGAAAGETARIGTRVPSASLAPLVASDGGADAKERRSVS